MRDLLVSAAIAVFLPLIPFHPWIGAMVWTWVSVMNPHRLAYGFASTIPWAAVVAGLTFIGLVLTSDRRRFPFSGATVTMILLLFWMFFTTTQALIPENAWELWDKVWKIYVMLFVTMFVLHTKRHIEMFIWVTIGSIAYYSVKGGIFTLLTGGGYRVFGPTGSFIEENNALGLATVMCIPIMNFIRLSSSKRWVKHMMLACMLLSAASALGSQSRGGLIAIAAMGVFLWWRGKNKALGLVGLLLIVPPLIAFMPESWEQRMSTIQNYHEDESAMARLNTWTMIINMVADRPIIGGGFNPYTQETYARWMPDADVFVAHSIYFQMLGEHGWPGLLLYLLFWFLIWRTSIWIRRETRGNAEYQWAFWLASMSQACFVGFAAGGAFLSLAYFDVPYNFAVALLLTRRLIEEERAARRGKSLAPAAAAGRNAAPPSRPGGRIRAG